MKKLKAALSLLLVLSFLLVSASASFADTDVEPNGKKDIPTLFSITEEK